MAVSHSSQASNELTRLAAASAVLLGPRYRARVLERARDRHRATAPEVGLDYGLLARVAKAMEDHDTPYWLGLVGLGLVAAGALTAGVLGAGGWPLALAALLGVEAIALHKGYVERYRLAPFFDRARFDPDAVLRRFRAEIDPDLAEGVLRTRGNVVVHAGWAPFVGAGFPAGSWSLAVDLSRSLSGGESRPFALRELYARLGSAVEGLGIPGLASGDALFVNGKELGGAGRLLPDRFGRPVQNVASAVIESYVEARDPRVRHYRWFRLESAEWGGELAASYFLRCTTVGHHLFVELSRHLLTPLAARYRAVDALPAPTPRAAVRWALATALRAPLAVAQGVWALARRARLRGARRDRRRIASDPLYNYGVAGSLRESLSDPHFAHYFQKMDDEMYRKAIEHCLLSALSEFLVEHDVDPVDLQRRHNGDAGYGAAGAGKESGRRSTDARRAAGERSAEARARAKSERAARPFGVRPLRV